MRLPRPRRRPAPAVEPNPAPAVEGYSLVIPPALSRVLLHLEEPSRARITAGLLRVVMCPQRESHPDPAGGDGRARIADLGAGASIAFHISGRRLTLTAITPPETHHDLHDHHPRR